MACWVPSLTSLSSVACGCVCVIFSNLLPESLALWAPSHPASFPALTPKVPRPQDSAPFPKEYLPLFLNLAEPHSCGLQRVCDRGWVVRTDNISEEGTVSHWTLDIIFYKCIGHFLTWERSIDYVPSRAFCYILSGPVVLLLGYILESPKTSFFFF